MGIVKWGDCQIGKFTLLSSDDRHVAIIYGYMAIIIYMMIIIHMTILINMMIIIFDHI